MTDQTQFQKLEKVVLLDPEDHTKKVAIGEISGMDRDLFHLKPVPSGWLRIDVMEVFDKKFPLMHPHEPADQFELGDTLNGVALWKQKHVVALRQRYSCLHRNPICTVRICLNMGLLLLYCVYSFINIPCISAKYTSSTCSYVFNRCSCRVGE